MLRIIKSYNIILHLSVFSLPLLFVVIQTFIYRLKTNMLQNWEGLSYFILIYPSLIFIFLYLINSKKVLKRDYLEKINKKFD